MRAACTLFPVNATWNGAPATASGQTRGPERNTRLGPVCFIHSDNGGIGGRVRRVRAAAAHLPPQRTAGSAAAPHCQGVLSASEKSQVPQKRYPTFLCFPPRDAPAKNRLEIPISRGSPKKDRKNRGAISDDGDGGDGICLCYMRRHACGIVQPVQCPAKGNTKVI